jgi:hypothetical protein
MNAGASPATCGRIKSGYDSAAVGLRPKSSMIEEAEGNDMEELLIEDAEACQLAVELAELTGDSLRLAVVTALREERDRALARRRRHERIMAITREIALSAA